MFVLDKNYQTAFYSFIKPNELTARTKKGLIGK